MSDRRVKQTVKGFLNAASKIVRPRVNDSLFQGSSSSNSRRAALLRHVQPELGAVPIALQREEVDDSESDEDQSEEQSDEEAGEDQSDEEAAQDPLEEDQDQDLMSGSQPSTQGSTKVRRRRRRRSHYVAPPPVPRREEDRPIITPVGDSAWDDTSFEGKGRHRQVNAVLGNLVRLHYPGVVTGNNGQRFPAQNWKHYSLVVDLTHGDAQGAVWSDFWKRFRLDDTASLEDKERAKIVFHNNAKKLISGALSNARIQVTYDYLKRFAGQNVPSFRAASDTYLTEEQYAQVMISWLEDRPEAYRALCALWASPEWIAKSRQKRECRGFTGGHSYGPDGHLRLAKRMHAETGVVPSPVEVFVRGHKACNPSQPGELCTAVASARLERYGEEVMKTHGEDYDWRKGPIDEAAVYARGGGKPHGRYPLFNGLVDTREARSSRGSSSQSSSGTSRCRMTQKDLEVERLQEKLRQQELIIKAKDDYLAAHMLQMQTAMQALAQQQGQNIVIPAWQPPPIQVPMFPPPAVQGSGTHVSHFSQTPSPNLPAPGRGDEEHDLANQLAQNIFGSGGSAHNSNDPPLM